MQKNSKISHFAFIFILAILILTGCTQETETEDTSVYTPECSVPELIIAINDANNDGQPSEIQLPANCVYPLTHVENSFPWNNMIINNGLPAIISEITIRGNNSTISIQPAPGEDPFGHFYLDVESKLYLYDLTLSGGARNVGGSVISIFGDLLVYNVKFLNNRAIQPTTDTVANGGAIYSYFGKVRILANSLFQGNLAGVPVPAGDNLGGAVYTLNSSLLINDSTFIDNYVAGHGGAVYSEKTSGSPGGGLITIQNGVFHENYALNDGGALAVKNEREGVFIVSSQFFGNQSEGRGGAIFSQDSDVDTSHNYFQNNQAENGGAVYTRRSAEGEMSIFVADSSTFVANTAEQNAGALFSENSDLETSRTIFIYNLADSCGALQLGGYPGMDVAAGDLETAPRINSRSELELGNAANNTAYYGFGGGACHLMGELILDEFNFYGNETPSYGGGLLSMDELEATGSVFSDNQAYRGGGLAVGFPVDDNNPLSPAFLGFYSRLTQTRIIDNVATDQGGGIWAHNGGSLQIIKSTIGGNTADQEGGGVYLDEGYLYVRNSTLADNTAYRGGGLYKVGDGGELDLKHTTVAYNTATDTGTGSRSGGGGVNTKGPVFFRQALIVLNTNNDCYHVQGVVTGGTQWFPDTYHAETTYGVDSDGTCPSHLFDTENIPEIESFNGTYVPIQGGSPLIDRPRSFCYSSTDQIGTSRPPQSGCEPGSIEYDPNAPPPPPPPPPMPEPSGETGECDPFAGLEISVHQLSINPNTMVMPVYLRFPEAAPGIGQDGSVPYMGTLGGVISHLVNQQGFPDRVYFMFEVGTEMPGTLQNLEIRKEGCDNLIFTEPRLTIPDLPADDQPGDDQPSPGCNKDLGAEECKKAGGDWVINVYPPYCDCP